MTPVNHRKTWPVGRYWPGEAFDSPLIASAQHLHCLSMHSYHALDCESLALGKVGFFVSLVFLCDGDCIILFYGGNR